MSGFHPIYVAAWSTACLVALVVFLWDRRSFALGRANYWRFLFKPWKIGTFLIAAVGLALIAPLTGDPTWDYFDASFMSVLTFLTAPWSVGALYKVIKRKLPWKHGIVAVCIWIFTASWSYDLYILIRDGLYPGTWLSNMFLSSILYVSAGLFWSLDWREGKGVFFAFTQEDWPSPSTARAFNRIFWYALPFMILVAAMMAPFLWPHIKRL